MPRVLVCSAAHILSDYLLTSEGTTCYNLFKFMAKYGYQFEALSPYIRVRKPLNNVTFHQVGSFKITPTSHALYRSAFHGEFLLRGLFKARELLKKRRIEIVHHMLPAVFNYTFSPLALLSKHLKQSLVFGPVSAHFRERPLGERILLPITSELHRKTIQKCDRIIAISNQAKELYKNLFDEEKISVIPFGVDTDAFRPVKRQDQREEYKILCVGSLYRLKGVQYLIYAMAEVRKRGLEASLTIVGEGQQETELIALAKKLGIDKHVVFAGFVPYSNMPQHYQSCDIFCFPTLGEPFGKSIIEAMACGKPVIAANAGGPAEIVQDRENGILVPPANSKVLAEEVAGLIKNERKMRKMGEKARHTAVQRFSWNIIAEQYHQLYSELL